MRSFVCCFRNVTLSSRGLTGTIPSFISALSALTVLCLQNNSLSGTIPNAIGNLLALQFLSLWGNQLSGSIPSTLPGLAGSLTMMDLSQNALNGTIPSVIGSLSLLQVLALSVNQLVGTVPDKVTALTALNYLDLHSNHLNGTIPTGIGSLTTLTMLNLGSNSLSGPLSPLSGLSSLMYVVGILVRAFGACLRCDLTLLFMCRNLRLSTNQFNGTLPDAISVMTRLSTLLLSSNRVLGTIPTGMFTLTKLRYVGRVAMCTRSGSTVCHCTLGAATVRRPLHRALDLSSNLLSGGVGTQIASLTALRSGAIWRCCILCHLTACGVSADSGSNTGVPE